MSIFHYPEVEDATAAQTVFTADGEAVPLPDKPLASGGGGKIFEHPGRPDMLLKIWHTPTPGDGEKIVSMVAKKLPEATEKQVAWPLAALRNREGVVVGYSMRRVEGLGADRLEVPGAPKELLDFNEAFSLYHYRSRFHRLDMFISLCRLVDKLHRLSPHIVIADLKPQNLIADQSGELTLIDIDGIQWKAPGRSGELFTAPLTTPEYRAPEWQAAAAESLALTQTADRFAMAVTGYKLLFGIHPFSVGPQQYRDRHLTTIPEMILNGCHALAPDISKPPFLHQPAALLPKELSDLFVRAFVAAPGEPRPSGAEWIEELRAYKKSFARQWDENYAAALRATMGMSGIATEKLRKGLPARLNPHEVLWPGRRNTSARLCPGVECSPQWAARLHLPVGSETLRTLSNAQGLKHGYHKSPRLLSAEMWYPSIEIKSSKTRYYFALPTGVQGTQLSPIGRLMQYYGHIGPWILDAQEREKRAPTDAPRRWIGRLLPRPGTEEGEKAPADLLRALEENGEKWQAEYEKSLARATKARVERMYARPTGPLAEKLTELYHYLARLVRFMFKDGANNNHCYGFEAVEREFLEKGKKAGSSGYDCPLPLPIVSMAMLVTRAEKEPTYRSSLFENLNAKQEKLYRHAEAQSVAILIMHLLHWPHSHSIISPLLSELEALSMYDYAYSPSECQHYKYSLFTDDCFYPLLHKWLNKSE